MADNDFGFDEKQRPGITRYVVWTIVACLALGAILQADGYFDKMIEEVVEGPSDPATDG